MSNKKDKILELLNITNRINNNEFVAVICDYI